MSELIIGIDPGKHGGLAALRATGELLDVVDMPVLDGRTAGHLIDEYFADFNPTYAVVELNHAMPRNGSVANFSLGMNTGILIGVIQAWRIPLIKVGSGKWKMQMGLRGKPKDASRGLAMDLWPEMGHMFKRVRDDGRAEAALIGRWWCHQLQLGAKAERKTDDPDGSVSVLQRHRDHRDEIYDDPHSNASRPERGTRNPYRYPHQSQAGLRAKRRALAGQAHPSVAPGEGVTPMDQDGDHADTR